MEQISVEMYCPISLKKLTVYCFEITQGVIVSNGCEFMHRCQACDECCARSVPLAEKELKTLGVEFPLHKP